jgi:peptidoglycan/LPS O-acetylase OafA/YrhL
MVIAFHLGYGWIPGGFVGVDVFFVLSGYLITGILVAEADRSGGIALGRFYGRRARRLLPASIAVLLAVMAMGSWLFDAVQRDALGRDALWSALYAANWRFATVGGDYFAPGDVPSPLVHYWSLAVEEQFYLVWPAAFALAFRRLRSRTALLGTVVALGAASAVASILTAGSPIAYYGTHTRAYQLLAGAALAVAAGRWGGLDRRHHVGARDRALGPVLVGAAVAALGWLAWSTPDATNYPGWSGIAVTVAALALVYGLDLTPAGPAQRVFGAGLPAAVGRWSYSLYIWHWPVVVLAPLVAVRLDQPWIARRSTLVVAMATVAGISYLAIERPIRFHLAPGARPVRVALVGLALSLLTAAAARVVFPPLEDFRGDALAAVRDMARPEPCPYFADEWPSPGDAEPCLWRDGTGPTVAFVGDSHAQMWQPAFDEIAERTDARLIRATRGGCPANDITVFIRNEAGRNETDTDCTEWRHRVYRDVVDRYDPDVVFVATRSHVRGITTDGGDIRPGDPGHDEAWAAGWDPTLELLGSGGATVAVSTIVPTLAERVPACLIDHGPDTTRCDFPVAVDVEGARANEVITALARGTAGEPGTVVVVDPIPLACPDGVCPALIDDLIVHRDDNHLSATFVAARAHEFGALLAAVGITAFEP